MNFLAELKHLLVDERAHSVSEAQRLCDAHPAIVTRGIIAGKRSVRKTALALEAANAGEEPEEEL